MAIMLRGLSQRLLFRCLAARKFSSLDDVLARINRGQPLSNHEESYLQQHLSALQRYDFTSVLKYYKSHSFPSKEFGHILKEETLSRAHGASFHNWQNLMLLTRMKGNLDRAEVDLLPDFQLIAARYLRKETLASMKLFHLKSLLSAYLALVYPTHLKTVAFPTVEQRDLFDLAEEVLKTKVPEPPVKSPDIELWHGVLRVYVLGDKGSEDFRRMLEAIVFKSLEHLKTDTFVDLPFMYWNRVTFDYYYISESVIFPYMQEAVRRFPQFCLRDLALVVYRVWWSFSKFGLCYNPEFTDLIRKKLETNEWMNEGSAKDVTFFASNLVVYFSHASLTHLTSTIDRAVEGVLQLQSELDDKTAMQLAFGLSRLYYFHKDYFAEVFKRVDRLLESEELRGYLYATLLVMQYSQPDLHAEFLSHPGLASSIPSMKAEWRKQRDADLAHSKPSFVQREVEAYLTSRGCRFEAEYYDDYYIDIALPDHKIAIELCGTMHFIHPHKTLNGKTQAKKFVLESKGWRVVILPFFSHGTLNRLEKNLDELLAGLLPDKEVNS